MNKFRYFVRIVAEPCINGDSICISFGNRITHTIQQPAWYMRIFCVVDYMNVLHLFQYLRGGIFAVIVDYTDVSKFICPKNQFFDGFFLVVGRNDDEVITVFFHDAVS